MPKIPFVSLYNEETKELLDSILMEFRNAVTQSQFILSEKVTAFENKIATLSGTDHAVAVNSGLDAVILSLKALGIGPGDEVISAPNSFLASASAVALIGAKPVFADVTEDFNLDPKKLLETITPRTKAVIPVHLTGNPCQMDQIMEICHRHNISVVEDAAQAIGARFNGRSVGSWGKVNAFSLHPLKNLHVWGDGGIITTNQASLAEYLRKARNHGLKNRDESDFFSYNSRLDSLQAIVGLAFAELLPQINEKRRKNAQVYFEELKNIDGIELPIVDSKASPVFHVFQLRVKKRLALKAHLESAGIETKIHYPIPIHLQVAASHLGYKRGDFPVCERLSEQILSIPVRENLTESELMYICETIRSAPSLKAKQ